MASLFEYMKQTQRFIRDGKQELVNWHDLVVYINRARREIAMRTQSIRRLTPISGQIVSATVTAGGHGYSSNPTVTITPPDFPSGYLPMPNGDQATATATVTGGIITGVNIPYGGYGYFEPIITITDPTGTGATAVANLSPLNLLLQGQEVYNFTDVDMSMFAGIGGIYSVRSISVLFSNYRYSLPMYSFSVYQSMIRQYSYQYQYVPTMSSQFGQGAQGSIYAYPLPSQTYQWEWDCSCLPADMVSDTDFEALPDPWTDAVPYFAAHLAFLELGAFNNARSMLELFDRQVGRYSTAVRPGRVTNPYGRW